jgi:hypothetical protein
MSIRRTRIRAASRHLAAVENKMLPAKDITVLYLRPLEIPYTILLNIAFFTASRVASTVNNDP